MFLRLGQHRTLINYLNLAFFNINGYIAVTIFAVTLVSLYVG